MCCLQELIDMTKNQELIQQVLLEKGGMKQDVFETSKEIFGWLKEIVKELAVQLTKTVVSKDSRIEISVKEIGDNEIHLICAGDILVFQAHSNVFKFEPSHALWQTGYLKEDANRAFCGMIYMYNFLADSIKYKRHNDLGYLVGRMFVNHEKHFFVEGKRRLGFLYNNFGTEVLTKEALKEVLLSTILYTLDFDLFMPPYSEMSELSVYQLNELRDFQSVKTGKRLGFKFSADTDEI